MQVKSGVFKQGVVLVALMGFLAIPCIGVAGEVRVQTEVNHSFAVAGEQGIGNYALIHVVVTQAGKPVTNLGDSLGDGTDDINLPGAWTLKTLSTPKEGCNLTPVEFINSGKGVYTIEVLPPLSNTGCSWVVGDYVYAVQISAKNAVGSGLGVLTIPIPPAPTQ